MSEQDERGTARIRPWQWPGEWVRDEKFWRDVVARATATLLAALVLYVGALVLGYVTLPAARPVIKFVLQLGWGLGIFWGLIAVMNVHYDRQRERGEPLGGFRWFVAYPLTLLWLALLFGGWVLIGAW